MTTIDAHSARGGDRRIAVLTAAEDAAGRNAVPSVILEAAGSHATPLAVDVPGAPFPDTPAAREEAARAFLDASLKAAQEGCDALFVNSVGDYGVSALRRKLKIPVVGSGEAAIRCAQMLGAPFAIVTVWPPKLRFLYDAVLRETCAAADCAAISHLSEDDDLADLGSEASAISELLSCRPIPLERVRAACAAAVERDGAQTVVLGCTCMAGMADRLRGDGLRIVEPLRTGYLAAEMLIRAEH